MSLQREAGTPPHSDSRLGLIADVGGTNARFALVDIEAQRPELLMPRSYLCADIAGIVEAAMAYREETGRRPRLGAFAVAGIVRGAEARITNRPWRLTIEAARRALQLEELFALNDFEAVAFAIPALGQDEQFAIGGQELPRPNAGGSFAVLGPGTGLGVSALRLDGANPIVVSSEGGHSSLAPCTDEEIEVLRCLRQRFGRVSYERVLSGPGLSNLHAVLCALHDRDAGTLAPEEITRRARTGDDMSARAVEMFCGWLGAFAGDAALMFGAWDGVYLAGGLIGELAEALKGGTFRERFEDKGRLSVALSQVPSVAVLRTDLGLAGAASALRRFSAQSAA